MNPIYLWSGGVDSSHMIELALRGGSRACAGYIRQLNDNPRETRENAARTAMLPYLKSLGDFVFIGQMADYTQQRGNLHPSMNMAHFASNQPENTCCYVGYLLDDAAAKDMPMMNAVVQYWGGFTRRLAYPLRTQRKADVLRAVSSEIMRHATWCDRERDHCGTCPSCLQVARAIEELQ